MQSYRSLTALAFLQRCKWLEVCVLLLLRWGKKKTEKKTNSPEKAPALGFVSCFFVLIQAGTFFVFPVSQLLTLYLRLQYFLFFHTNLIQAHTLIMPLFTLYLFWSCKLAFNPNIAHLWTIGNCEHLRLGANSSRAYFFSSWGESIRLIAWHAPIKKNFQTVLFFFSLFISVVIVIVDNVKKLATQ